MLVLPPLPRAAIKVAVATGAHHTVLVTTAGRVYTFGWDDRGQLGLRMNRPLPVPQCPPAPAARSDTADWKAVGEELVAVATGAHHTVAEAPWSEAEWAVALRFVELLQAQLGR